jgi:hypothetical protein
VLRAAVADFAARALAEAADNTAPAPWIHLEFDIPRLGRRVDADLPPLNVATFRERISGGANQGRARDATREEVHCGADHREAPRG